MALGIKIKNVKTKNSYTIESLFEAIQGHNFTAGTPSLIQRGPMRVITFPALDSENQVWILKSGIGKESNKFSVQKSEDTSVGGMATSAALNALTDGLFGFKGMVGKNAKKCEQMVEATAKELKALGL